jgi:uncharacterized protein (TIGR00251 family)
MDDFLRVTDGTLYLDIKAVPGASKTGFAGVKDKRLRVRIAAAPEDGKANAELISFLAKNLGCAKRDLRLVSGEKSRLKTIAMPPEYELKFREISPEGI